MYCRYCGAHIADDSVFCARCGKRLGRRVRPGIEKTIRLLRLNTPYPYALVALLGFAVYLARPAGNTVDYAHLKLTMNLDRNFDSAADALYQQSFSLHVENAGSKAVRQVPIELTARIEPEKPAEVLANFRGQQLPIMQAGKAMPLVVVLTDEIIPGSKHHFAIGGSIQADPPFKVTYEIRGEDSEQLLASYAVER